MHTIFFRKKTTLETRLVVCRVVTAYQEYSYALMDNEQCVIGYSQRDTPLLLADNLELALKYKDSLRKEVPYNGFPCSIVDSSCSYPLVSIDGAVDEDHRKSQLDREMVELQKQTEALYEQQTGNKFVPREISMEELMEQAVELYEQISGKEYQERSMDDICLDLEAALSTLQGSETIECTEYCEVNSTSRDL